VATYNPYQKNTTSDLGGTVENKGFFNRLLRNLSTFGMDYGDMVLKNTVAVGIHEDPNQTNAESGTNMYDIFTKKVISKVLNRKNIAYLDRSYEDKRKILRQYSIKDEIKGFLEDIANEAVIYNDDNQFCKMQDLPDEFDNTIKQKYQENYKKLMINFGFNDGITAWQYFKSLLIDGYITFELVYDNRQKSIIDLVPLDPMTLIVATDPGTSTVVWIQYPDNPQQRRVLLDSQIIYISYSNNNEYAETSYVENLIRPYNQLKLVEQTRLLYNINQAAMYKKFVIPVGGLTRQQAEQQVYQLMAEYHEDVQWDDRMGTVSINGSTDIPHSKDFWFPQSGEGTPDIEIMQSQGTDLNEDSMLNWFYKNLKRATHIPFSRFEEESGGGNIYSDSAEMTREEIKFGNYIRRLQTLFKEVIIKPLKIQTILDFPELKDDNLFHYSLKSIFNKNHLFEEWKYLNNLAKRSDIAATLSGNLQDEKGDPYLHIEWIVRNIMKLTDEDIAENDKYKMTGGGMAPGQGGGAPDSGGAPGGEGGDEGSDFGEGGEGDSDFGEGGGSQEGGVQGGDEGGVQTQF